MEGKYLKEFEKRIQEMLPIDNDAFTYFATNKGFCEELLQVLLEDDKLEVLENEPQKFLPNIYFKSSIIDMLCKLKDGRIANVEVQLYDEKEHAKRIFQYASMIRQSSVEKGTKYSNINDIIIIYLTKKDIFNKGNTAYDVKMDIISDTKEYIENWNCGLKVKYVNTEGTTNKRIFEYLQLLIDKKAYNIKYPETVKIKKEVFEVGGKSMSDWFQNLVDREKDGWLKEGVQQGKAEGITYAIVNLVKKGLLGVTEAAKELNISENELKKMITA